MNKAWTALVIHDIKNSLALLEIDLEQLNHRADAPSEGRRAYRRCIELRSRLVGFLTLYKHDQSGLNPMLTEVDLTEFIEDQVRNSQSAMMAENHHGHRITVSVASDRIKPPGASGSEFMFDENLVELALESALNNAVRYAHRKVEVWFELDADKVVFKVFDDGVGVGMVDELMQRNIAEKSSSTGLGLELCKAVAQAHGSGSVQLDNAAGGGTLFAMTLRHTG